MGGLERFHAVSGNVFVGEIVLVILLSLLFEALQDRLRERFKEAGDDAMVKLMDAIFKEITILGFIGLFVYIVTNSGGADQVAMYVLPFYTGEGENPLAESFEMVHVVIFCIMMVFITQATALSLVVKQLESTWDAWEQVPARGTDVGSLEAMFKAESYLDGAGFSGEKDFVYHKERWQDLLMRQDRLEALIRWRAIRHEFLFPALQEVTRMSTGMELKHTHKIDPVNFDFEMYLSTRLGDIILELVEIDPSTWIASILVICPCLAVFLTVDRVSVKVIQLVFSLSLLVFGGWLAHHCSFLMDEITPLVPKDPIEIMRLFLGTSIAELKRRQQIESRSDLGTVDGPNSNRLTAPFRQAVATSSNQIGGAPKRRYCIIRWMFGESTVKPNPQQRLYLFEENGISMLFVALQIMSFFQAVLVASLIVVGFLQPPQTNLEIACFLISWAEWPCQLFLVIPRCVSRVCVLSSVEYEKKSEVIEEVTRKVKSQRLRQTLHMLDLVKLRGRNRRKGAADNFICDDEFEQLLLSFHHLPDDQRKEMEESFEMFDGDNSGKIEVKEIASVLRAMGVGDDHEAVSAAESLVSLVDRSGDGTITEDAFKVLMMLALEKPSDAENKEDLRHFFAEADQDGSGEIDVKELAKIFEQKGMRLDEDEVFRLIYQCFHHFKTSLNADEFVQWMMWCENLGDKMSEKEG